jgi:transcriptional/translational regulatory protein YebC/TACO1
MYICISTRTNTLIINHSTDHGPDPDANPRLKTAIAEAKRQGFPKDSIEAALRRGQGLSTTGKPLEAVTVEAVLPPGVAAVIECLTESKLRTLSEVRNVITKAGGQVSPTQYLFDRKGKVTFKPVENLSLDSVMETALEQEGFEDIEEEESDGPNTGAIQFSITTEPNATKAVADTLVAEFGVEIESLEIEWQANSEVEVGGEEAEVLDQTVEKLREIGSVQNVWLNAAEGDHDAVT